MYKRTVPRRGVEQVVDSSDNTAVSETGGAERGALRAQLASLDPELVAVIDAWDSLPEVVRAGVVAMVRAAISAGE